MDTCWALVQRVVMTMFVIMIVSVILGCRMEVAICMGSKKVSVLRTIFIHGTEVDLL